MYSILGLQHLKKNAILYGVDARVGPMEACHTAYLQVGLLLQQVEHRCQWSTTHRGAYSGYPEEPAALDC